MKALFTNALKSMNDFYDDVILLLSNPTVQFGIKLLYELIGLIYDLPPLT